MVRVLQHVYSHFNLERRKWDVAGRRRPSAEVPESLVGGAGGGGAKGLPIPAFRGLLPAELTSRGRDRRHSAVAAGGCRSALWSRRSRLVVADPDCPMI